MYKRQAALKEENAMLSRLQKEILTDFPAPPQTEVEICHVDPEMCIRDRVAAVPDLSVTFRPLIPRFAVFIVSISTVILDVYKRQG